MMTTETELEEILIVYMGRCRIVGDKLGAQYLPVTLYDQCKTLEDCDKFSSPFTTKERELPRAVGAIYRCLGRTDENGQLVLMRGNAKFGIDDHNKRHIRHDWIAVWEARDKAFRVAERAVKELEKVRNDSKLENQLRTLRHRYGQTDAIGKLALEVVVLNILRNG